MAQDIPAETPDGSGEERSAEAGTPEGDSLAALVREPQQARSRKTLSRIMTAADALLVEKGPEALTVAAIARRARASVGSFYARFDGKEELVRYLGETALQTAEGDWSDRFHEVLGEALAETALAAGDSASIDEAEALAAQLRGLTHFLLEGFRSGPPSRLERLHRIEDPAPSRLARFHARVLEDLEVLFGQVVGSGDRQRRVGARMVLFTIRAFASEERGGGDGNPGRPEAGEVARAVSLYLSARPGAPAHEPRAEKEVGTLAPEAPAMEAPISPEPAASEVEERDWGELAWEYPRDEHEEAVEEPTEPATNESAATPAEVEPPAEPRPAETGTESEAPEEDEDEEGDVELFDVWA